MESPVKIIPPASPSQATPSHVRVQHEAGGDEDLETALPVIPSLDGPNDNEAERAERPKPASSPRLLARMGTKSKLPPVDSHTHHHTLQSVKGVVPTTVQISLNVAGQHTLSWTTSLTPADGDVQEEDVLPAGSCNLYLFPMITTENGTSLVPQADMLVALQTLFLAIATDVSCTLLDIQDVVGALPMHAITVANTAEAISMAEMMYTAK